MPEPLLICVALFGWCFVMYDAFFKEESELSIEIKKRKKKKGAAKNKIADSDRKLMFVIEKKEEKRFFAEEDEEYWKYYSQCLEEGEVPKCYKL